MPKNQEMQATCTFGLTCHAQRAVCYHHVESLPALCQAGTRLAAPMMQGVVMFSKHIQPLHCCQTVSCVNTHEGSIHPLTN